MLALLVNNPHLRQEMGARGQERIRERYLWPDIVAAIEKTYYGVLGRSHPEPMPAVETRSPAA